MSTWSVIPAERDHLDCQHTDQIVKWSEVREGDHVLWEGRLRPVTAQTLNHPGELYAWANITVAIPGDDDKPHPVTWRYRADDLTAVRRCSCRKPKGAAA